MSHLAQWRAAADSTSGRRSATAGRTWKRLPKKSGKERKGKKRKEKERKGKERKGKGGGRLFFLFLFGGRLFENGGFLFCSFPLQTNTRRAKCGSSWGLPCYTVQKGSHKQRSTRTSSTRTSRLGAPRYTAPGSAAGPAKYET